MAGKMENCNRWRQASGCCASWRAGLDLNPLRVTDDDDVRWLSAESPGILPGTDAPAVDDQMYALARDGRPVATADSHGTWVHWPP
jgi:hypothetical protein